MSTFETTFKQLLAAWNQHQDLRASGAHSAALYESRAQLDTLRSEAALLRTQR